MIFIFLIFFSLFWVWTLLVVSGKICFLDDKIYNMISFSNFKTHYFRFITNAACTKFFVVLSLLMLIFMRSKSMAITLVLLLIISSGLIGFFKRIIRRERPNIKRLVKETGYSYPSGHTISGTSFYAFLGYLVAISSLSLLFKIILIVLLVSLILNIGYSRIYLGVHYFSDVIGAMLLSVSYVAIYVYFMPYIINFISNI